MRSGRRRASHRRPLERQPCFQVGDSDARTTGFAPCAQVTPIVVPRIVLGRASRRRSTWTPGSAEHPARRPVTFSRWDAPGISCRSSNQPGTRVLSRVRFVKCFVKCSASVWTVGACPKVRRTQDKQRPRAPSPIRPLDRSRIRPSTDASRLQVLNLRYPRSMSRTPPARNGPP